MSRNLIPMLLVMLFLLLFSGSALADRLFWPDLFGGKIQTCNLDGSGQQDLAIGLDQPFAIAVDRDGRKVYWLELNFGQQRAGRIRRADMDGDNMETLVSGLFAAGALAVDAARGKLYWGSLDNGGVTNIHQADLNGANPEILIANAATGLGITAMAVDPVDSKMYWVTHDPYLMRRADLDGTNVETIATVNQTTGLAIESDARKLYWVEISTFSTIFRSDLDGENREALTTIEATLQGIALYPALGEMYVGQSGGGLYRYRTDGSDRTLVLGGVSPSALAIALDAEIPHCVPGSVNAANGEVTNVLWVNGESGDVSIGETGFLAAYVTGSPAGGSGGYVIHANFGRPTAETVRDLKAQLGSVCFPFFLQQGASPAAVWNNIGKTHRVGATRYFDGTSEADPAPAPAIFLTLLEGDPQNLPIGTVLTLQGVTMDDGSSSPLGASTTNAVILTIVP